MGKQHRSVWQCVCCRKLKIRKRIYFSATQKFLEGKLDDISRLLIEKKSLNRAKSKIHRTQKRFSLKYFRKEVTAHSREGALFHFWNRGSPQQQSTQFIQQNEILCSNSWLQHYRMVLKHTISDSVYFLSDTSIETASNDAHCSIPLRSPWWSWLEILHQARYILLIPEW